MECWAEWSPFSNRVVAQRRQTYQFPCRVLGEGIQSHYFQRKSILLYHSVDPTGSQTVSRVTPFLYNSTLETRLTFLCFWNAILQRASFAFI